MAGTPALQTVLKTVEVLEALSGLAADYVALAQVADALGWSRPATHQYLSSLVRAGWLEQDASRRYRLASGATLFARSVVEHSGTPAVILQEMEQLVSALQEPISFAILHGDEAVIIERREPLRPLIHRNPERHLGLATASGQVLLAFDRRVPAQKRAEFAALAKTAMRKGYGEVRDRPWMGDEVEAIAVPVMRNDWCLGALSVIAPVGRMSIPDAIEALTNSRARIESSLARA